MDGNTNNNDRNVAGTDRPNVELWDSPPFNMRDFAVGITLPRIHPWLLELEKKPRIARHATYEKHKAETEQLFKRLVSAESMQGENNVAPQPNAETGM